MSPAMLRCCCDERTPSIPRIEPESSPDEPTENTVRELAVRYLWPGNQYASYGDIDVQRVAQLAAQLNPRCADLAIQFSVPEEDWIWGGTCTAMALKLIQGYQTSKGSERTERVQQLEQDCADSTQRFRNIQALFNGIHKTTPEDPTDFRRRRIEAMARFYQRKVVDVSHTVNSRSVDEVAQLLCELPKGTYLLRVIAPEDNRKGESHGHSVSLLKKAEGIYYYDPNYGAYAMTLDSTWPTLIAGSVAAWSVDFSLHELRAYKIKARQAALAEPVR